jgi:hypothetical protein
VLIAIVAKRKREIVRLRKKMCLDFVTNQILIVVPNSINVRARKYIPIKRYVDLSNGK